MTGMTSLNTSFTVTFPQDWRNIAECGNLRAPSGVSSWPTFRDTMWELNEARFVL